MAVYHAGEGIVPSASPGSAFRPIGGRASTTRPSAEDSPFSRYRFSAAFGTDVLALDAARMLGEPRLQISTVESAPGGVLTLTTTHMTGRPTLCAQMLARLPTGQGLFVVWLERVDRRAGSVLPGGRLRRIAVTFSGYEWLPFLLDAGADEIAIERLRLTGCVYVPAEDSALAPEAAP